MGGSADHDIAIVGGGFFGCCLALYLRSVSDRIVVIEEQPEVMTRASRVNQARIHSGFHYPRSFVTALRSRHLSARFARDFEDAVTSDFRMLYAIAKRRSKVSTARFIRMFQDMKAPISAASPSDRALFNPELVDGVFDCLEFAFDWKVLRNRLTRLLDASGITVMHGETARKTAVHEGLNRLELASGRTLTCDVLFNVAYGGLNVLPTASGFAPLPLKYELAEIALVSPPAELAGKAVTVMDGPFFSLMPYPAERLYSLTHVRYTPHHSWVDGPGQSSAYDHAAAMPEVSRWRHMVMDSARYLPSVSSVEYQRSLFDVKTILSRNEQDDGRPILLHRHSPEASFYSIMGGKIDNIYDLFPVLNDLEPRFSGATDCHLFGRDA